MTFEELLDQALAMLQRRGRVTYRTLKRQFQLDDDALEDLKAEVIKGQRLAVDEDGEVLVWTGGTASASAPAAAPVPVQAQAPLTYTPPHLTEKILAARPALEGERKQVTVFFADLKDSTRLIEGLDPEAAQQLLDPAIHLMMDAVHRYEGTVNQVLGDGIMALFGAPIAHEDHALRACYAALALQNAIQTYAEAVRRTHGMLLQLRVGLNSGEVVVRAIGNDLHTDYSAVGQHTVLAARMEQLAAPGSILLTGAVLRLVEGLVRVTALGPLPVKGFTEPVEGFGLLGASDVRRRLQAAALRGLTRFVGREPELTAVTQALERAGAGHGQVVALVGEAGVGKSRLIYECVHSHRTQGWRVLEAASVSYGKATPYFPVLDLLRRYAQVDDHDDPRTIRAKVTGHVLTLDESLQETLPALLWLLDALPDDSPFRALEPPQRRQRTLVALQRLLLRDSQVQPLLLVFEDLHWIDSETQALLGGLVERLPTARLLLLVNYRPEYQHGWGSKTYYTQLRLDPLPPASADEFLQALLGDDPRLVPLKQLLIERTEGNPFFLEESMRTLVETGVLVGAPGAYVLGKPLDSLQVPATVQAVLSARIDRLPPEEKRLIQTAAVIGTEVPWPLLQAITELPEAALHRGLAHLQAAEFLYETCLFPEPEYTFKHALTHEVAYNSLLLERRRGLHARIVDAIEQRYPDRLAEHVERLAHHAFRGEVWDKAIVYYRQAGAKAAARPAYREAVACFEQALVALRYLPDSRAVWEQAIDLRLDLRSPLARLGESGRVLDHLHEAETLAEALGDQSRLAYVSSYLADYLRLMGSSDRALAAGQRALALAAALEDISLQAMTQEHLGTIYYYLGDYRRATEVLRQNVGSLEGEPRREPFDVAGPDAVESRTRMVLCLAEVGAFAEGLSIAAEGVRMAEAIEHPLSLARAYHSVGALPLHQGDVQQAIPALGRGLALCRAWDIWDWLLALASTLGYAYALCGRLAEALPLLEQAVEPEAGASRRRPDALARLSKAYLLGGRGEEAMPLARQALDLARDRRERGHEAWALHLLGEIHVHQEPSAVEPAEAHYQQALALADELGMRPLVAHCHFGLGTLYLKMAQREQARAELSTAIELYRAMGMTFWLPQAEAALVEVEGR
jgi:class 3 adenylate cyclase/tetratricopeptide (TPR) repeat protein